MTYTQNFTFIANNNCLLQTAPPGDDPPNVKARDRLVEIIDNTFKLQHPNGTKYDGNSAEWTQKGNQTSLSMDIVFTDKTKVDGFAPTFAQAATGNDANSVVLKSEEDGTIRLSIAQPDDPEYSGDPVEAAL